jgi:very-short-patch-repair endonuclease
MLFHAHLLHSDFADQIQVPTPSWLMHEARGAWMQNARGDNTESRPQKRPAAVVELLGLTYEVEHPTEDGYFSIDIALPNQRTALEFDGPSHFMNDGANTKTAKTELRDLLLQKRGWRVVSVPYFE